jgi:hypothetical protein
VIASIRVTEMPSRAALVGERGARRDPSVCLIAVVPVRLPPTAVDLHAVEALRSLIDDAGYRVRTVDRGGAAADDL